MAISLAPLISSRELLVAWTVRTIRARYQQSLLGWFWAIVQPAASVAIYSLVFTLVVPVQTGGFPYPVFSYIAVVPWTLLSTSLTDMTGSLVGNIALVQKIYFPRQILAISAMAARLMDFGVAASLLVILMLAYHSPFFLSALIYLPLILVVQLMLTTGLGLACAALNVFYRDVQTVLVLVLQLWFYASPVIYPVSLVPERYTWIYYLNPMAGILQAYRDTLLTGAAPGLYLLPAALFSLLLLLGGQWIFRRYEPLFADII